MPITAKQYISPDISPEAISSVFRHVGNPVKGEVYGLITINGDGSFPVDRVSKFMWDGVLDGYRDSRESSVTKAIEDGYRNGIKNVSELIKNDPHLEEQGINVGLTVVVVKRDTVYLGIMGDQEIYLYKDEKFINISQMFEENNVKTGSLKMGEEDVLLVSSAELLTSFVSTLVGEDMSMNVVGDIEGFAEGLSGNQGMLMLADDEMIVTPPEQKSIAEDTDDVTQEIVQETVEEIVKEEEEVDSLPHEDVAELVGVEDVGKDKKFDIGETKEKINNGLTVVGDFMGKVWDFIQRVVGTVGGFLANVMGNLFGKKLWYKRVASKFSAMRLGKGTASVKGTKIDGYMDKSLRNKRMAIGGVVLVVVITVLMGIKFTKQATVAAELHASVVSAVEAASEYADDAEKNLQSDSVAAETAMFNAYSSLEELDGTEITQEDQASIDAMKETLQGLDDRLNRRTPLSEEAKNIESYLDTRLTFGEGSNASDITIMMDTFLNEHIFIADKGLAEVYKVTLFDKGVGRIPDSGNILKSPSLVDLGVNGIYIYDEEVGVVTSQLNDADENLDLKVLSGLDRGDISATTISEMAIFTASDNVYLLSQDQGAVLKSANSGGGYGLLYTYMSGDTFGMGEDIFGDFSIYLLVGSSGLERYSYDYSVGQVTQSPISVTNVKPSAMNLTAGYTGETLDYRLYAFDAKEKRVLVFEKPNETVGNILHPGEMVMLKQYEYRGDRSGAWENVKDIVVDQAENYMYILDGNTVWKVDLRSS